MTWDAGSAPGLVLGAGVSVGEGVSFGAHVTVHEGTVLAAGVSVGDEDSVLRFVTAPAQRRRPR